MTRITIGLYKHKKTGQFDTMVDKIDNVFKVHNGEFEKIAEFEHYEESLEDDLRKDISRLKSVIEDELNDYFIPVFCNARTMDDLPDEEINHLRENLYRIMNKRRELLKELESKE